jgi:DnaK suppressor protein
MAKLTPAQHAQIGQAMNVRYQSLLEKVRDELENSGEQQYVELLGRVPADIGDESTADALADMQVARIDRQIHELRAIELARKRLKDGVFGTCENCGDNIPFERLMAYPTAQRCIICQQQHEKTHAVEGRPTL